MTHSHEEDSIDYYGDEHITSYHGKVPLWLKIQYVFWIAWGVVWFFLYWNGSWGYLDKGYWHQLQISAQTTFPQQDSSELNK